MPDLPAGTVTFLFTDIEGSTDLVRRLGDARYAEIRALHHQHVREALRAHQGQEVDTQGDGFFVSFSTARSALNCAIQILRGLRAQPWPEGVAVRVRTGLHTGEPVVSGVGYVGMDVHRTARICAAGYGEQILLSQASYALVRHDLPPGVTVRDLREHRLKDLPHPEHIYQIVLTDVPSEFPPLRSLSSSPNNLPVQLTTFIGREREIADVTTLLDKTRLLTLTGPGGCGKSRLAIEVAARLIDRFPDGIWFIELAPLSDASLLPQTVSAALGLLGDRGRPTVNALASYLEGRTALLILDTCEHLRDPCAELVAAVIRRPGTVKFIATSRELLGIPGEVPYPVPSLGIPPSGERLSLQALRKSEAVQLFLERARIAAPESVESPSAGPLAEIVQRLEGVPLAIELAAAKTKVLSVAEIAERLTDRFKLLNGSSGATRGRHRTLRATVDWSYALLSGRERRLLRWLAVFSGGCSLDAVVGVCTVDETSETALLDLLTSLADKSLLIVDRSDPARTRYRLLDTIREYGAERLAEAGEAEDVRTRHRDWFLQEVERLAPSLYGPAERSLNLVEVNHDNLRAALAWSLQRGEAEPALRMALAVMRFWQVRGYWTEGRRWLDRALGLNVEFPKVLKLRALIANGRLAYYQDEQELVQRLGQQARALADEMGDLSALGQAIHLLAGVEYYHEDQATAKAMYKESLSYARRAADARLEAGCLINLASIALHEEKYEEARMLAQESLERFGRIGDRSGRAFAYSVLGAIEADMGHPATAESPLTGGLALARELGDRRSVATSLSYLGRVARDQGDYPRAEDLYRQCLDLRRDLGDPRGAASALAGLGITLGLCGKTSEGLAALKESLKMRLERGDRIGVAECLEGFGRVGTDPKQSTMLLAAAQTIRDEVRMPPPPSERRLQEDRIRELRGILGDDAFGAAWFEGAQKGLSAAPLPVADLS